VETATATEPEIGRPPERRRRWPWIALVSFLIVLAGFGAYAGWFLSNYQPLSVGGLGFSSGGVTGARDLGSFTSPQGEDFTAYRLVYQPGLTFDESFTLENAGPVGVTILAIDPIDPDSGDPAITSGIRISRQLHGGDFDTGGKYGEPFRPFSLAGHSYRAVTVEKRLVTCRTPSEPGGSAASSYSSVRVVYRVLGVTRHTEIPLDYTIELVFPNEGFSCPLGSQFSDPNVSTSSS
jgi:hypothetical protein